MNLSAQRVSCPRDLRHRFQNALPDKVVGFILFFGVKKTALGVVSYEYDAPSEEGGFRKHKK